MSDIFVPSDNGRASTRNSFQKLSQPFRKTTQGQNAIRILDPQHGISSRNRLNSAKL